MAETNQNMDILSIDEATEYLKFSKPYIYKLAKENKIPHIDFDSHILFRKIDLINWLGSDGYIPERSAGGITMNELISEVIYDVSDFIKQKTETEKYGDITITISLNDGVPVKLTRGFVEHFVQRKTKNLVVNK